MRKLPPSLTAWAWRGSGPRTDADGAQGNVERAGRKRLQQALRAKKHVFICRIVEEHGQDGFGGPGGLGWIGSDLRSLRGQRLRPLARAVPNG